MKIILEIIDSILNAKNDKLDVGDAFEAINRVQNSNMSVSSYARQNVCQFPLLMSTNASIEAAMRTANVLEQLYTFYIRMTITNNLDILDLANGENKSKMLRKLHQNDRANYGLADRRDVENTFSDLMNSESSSVLPFCTKYNLNKKDLKLANIELNTPYLENFNLGLLNGDEENSNLAIVNEDLNNIDDLDDNPERIEFLRGRYESVIRNRRNLHQNYVERTFPNASDREKLNRIEERLRDDHLYQDAERNFREIIRLQATIMDANSKRMQAMGSSQVMATRADATIKKNNDLEPSLLEMDVTYNNGNMMKSTKIAVGVKTIIHKINAAEMRYYLAESLIQRRPLFRFIQWTTGEIKFLKDFVLDLNNTRKEALTDRKSVKWWRHLRSRRTASKIRAFSGKSPLVPNATIVLTIEDVELLKLSRKIDLLKGNDFIRNPASKLMDNFFLLHIVVLDETSDMIYLYNRENEAWETYKLNKLLDEMKVALKNNAVLNLR